MKKFCSAFLLLLSATLFAEPSIADVLKSLDEAFMRSYSTKAQVTIGFITYADSNTCGSVVPYFQKEINNAAEATRRIEVVKTTELSEYEQAGVATRGVKMGMSAQAKTKKETAYILDGNYYDRGAQIELALTLHDADGNVFAKKSAFVSKSVLSEKKLTLYPGNKTLAEEIQKDFDKSEKELEEKTPVQFSQNKKGGTNSSSKSIGIAASMLDRGGSLVNMLHPNDVVKFKISADTDCYLAILCIDANGVKTWLPMTNNFIEADKVRFFPDIAGAVLKVNDDGVFGAEQVVIYASSSKEGLPAQVDSGRYSNEDLHSIMRRQQSARKNPNQATGTFKITYTIMEK